MKDKADENRDRFKELLFKMAASQDILSSKKEKRKIYLELEDIYYGKDGKNDFRHFYSDIFAVLSQIDNDTELGNIEILNQNMNILRRNYKPINREK